jgi:hypothetical protein
MIIGLYHLTGEKDGAIGEGLAFGSISEALLAHDMLNKTTKTGLDIQAKIRIRMNGELKTTTLGKALFNEALPEEFPYYEGQVGKKEIERIITDLVQNFPRTEVAQTLDRVKDAGFHWATRSGVSMAISDVDFDVTGKFDAERATLIAEAESEHTEVQQKFDNGLLLDSERIDMLGSLWNKTTQRIAKKLEDELKINHSENAIYKMVESKARGNWIQIRSIMGMRGPVAKSSGEFAAMPIKGNYLIGLTANEYFVNATGARKGNADTAMKTAAAGYLTRRLVDVAQDVIIRIEDCGTERSIEKSNFRTVTDSGTVEWDDSALALSVLHRTLAEDLTVGKTVIAKAGSAIDQHVIAAIKANDFEEVKVRTVLTCEAEEGLCAKCYGISLATGNPVELGEAVGIIAAQSIGEPGTQLTMRTFHTGGASNLTKREVIKTRSGGKEVRIERLISYDITQGLTGVTDLLENRGEGKAKLAHWPGLVRIEQVNADVATFEGILRAIPSVLSSVARKASSKLSVRKEEDTNLKGEVVHAETYAIASNETLEINEKTPLVVIAPVDSEVTSLSPDTAVLKDDRGKEYSLRLGRFFSDDVPTRWTSTAKVGDKVSKKDIIAVHPALGEIQSPTSGFVTEVSEVSIVISKQKPQMETADSSSESQVELKAIASRESNVVADAPRTEIVAELASSEDVVKRDAELAKTKVEPEKTVVSLVAQAPQAWAVKVGARVGKGQVLAHGAKQLTALDGVSGTRIMRVKDGEKLALNQLISELPGRSGVKVYVDPTTTAEYEFAVSAAKNFAFNRTASKKFRKLSPTDPLVEITWGKGASQLLVEDGQYIERGTPLNAGTPGLDEVLATQGREATAKVAIEGVQAIYGAQDVALHDKHLEVIVRQMLSKVTIVDSGETDLMPGAQMDRRTYMRINKEARDEGKKTASARDEVLGMTRASLAAESWLSAASFQETTRVLTQAALDRSTDKLKGLKENVIIGKLIPAGTGLAAYRQIDAVPTEEAKAERYPNIPWATTSDESIDYKDDSFSGAGLSFTSLEDYSNEEPAQ